MTLVLCKDDQISPFFLVIFYQKIISDLIFKNNLSAVINNKKPFTRPFTEEVQICHNNLDFFVTFIKMINKGKST